MRAKIVGTAVGLAVQIGLSLGGERKF